MKSVRIICRASELTVVQAETVRAQLISVNRGIEVHINAVEEGSNSPGSNFVDIVSKAIKNGEADLAVYSLKDVGYDYFLNHETIAIPFRDDVRDIVVFSDNILSILQDGKPVRIGIPSLQRSVAAKTFLEKAVPQKTNAINIELMTATENIDERLQKLRDGLLDGLILPAADIHQLLSGDTNAYLKEWWKKAQWMMLPLIECVPAAVQGAIVVEANPANEEMRSLLQSINNQHLMNGGRKEASIALRYEKAGIKEFGVTTIYYRHQPAYYAAGIDANGNSFEEWEGLPALDATGRKLFSATDFMKSFFAYADIDLPKEIPTPVAFVANYKAVQINGVSDLLREKKIWASGTRTWFELAKAGYWVWGSADALGLEFLHPLFATRLVNIRKEDICIVTHDDAAARWQQKGWKAVGTYGLAPKSNPAIEEQIKDADIVFWTSYNQYELYKDRLKKDVIHSCASGETASLLQAHGLNPVIFPNIKAFSSWRKKSEGNLKI